jgi:hypothetical protein
MMRARLRSDASDRVARPDIHWFGLETSRRQQAGFPRILQLRARMEFIDLAIAGVKLI